jgi:hypothetical protein
MTGHYHNGMDLLTAKDVERIYVIADHLRLRREWVVVPLNCAAQAVELVQPDGKLLLRPPGGDLLDPWIDGLEQRLSELDLSRVARLESVDLMTHLSGAQAPPSTGTPRDPRGRADLLNGGFPAALRTL